MAKVMNDNEVTLEIIRGLLKDTNEKVDELALDLESNKSELEEI